jgi:hypothetical protein
MRAGIGGDYFWACGRKHRQSRSCCSYSILKKQIQNHKLMAFTLSFNGLLLNNKYLNKKFEFGKVLSENITNKSI